MASRLTCASCGHRPYSPPSDYGEVRRVRSGSGRVTVTFWCRECFPEKECKPLHGIEAELALHCWLRTPISDILAGIEMDKPERKAIYANTLKPLSVEE